MAAPRKLPPDDVLREWFNLNLTHDQMVALIKEQYNVTVRRETVLAKLKELKLTRRPDVAFLIPWRLPHPQQNHYCVQMLRFLGRVGKTAIERGEADRFNRWYCSQANPDPAEDAWIWGLMDEVLKPRARNDLRRFIEARRRDNTVVYWYPSVGWKYTVRRPGKDKGLTADPNPDSGTHLRIVNS